MKEFIINKINIDGFNCDFDSFSKTEYVLVSLTTGEPCQRQSLLKIAYDQENLYFKFRCPYQEKFRKIVKSYNTKVYRGDCAEIFLAPYGDIKNYFEFDVSPFNGLCCIRIRNLDNYNVSAELIPENPIFTRTEIFESHYDVHYKIPFGAVLKNSNDNPLKIEWKFNAYRIDRHVVKKRFSQALCPTFCASHHNAKRFGSIKFI